MMKWSGELKNKKQKKKTLLISVVECTVILVGCRIWGLKRAEPRVSRKWLVSWYVSSFIRSKLKSTRGVQYLFSRWILSIAVFM